MANIMIYIPELWEVKVGTGDCDDKVSKTGDSMFGPLAMSDNKITGLSDEYPPGRDSATRWDHMTRYIQKRKGEPLYMLNENRRVEVSIDHSGINIADGNNLRVNIPGGGGPEIDIKQLHNNTPEALAGGIRIIRNDAEKHYQLGWDVDDTLTMYAVDLNNPPTKEVCKFSDRTITHIADPINNTDVVNKKYVDSKKPVICVWAASNGGIVNGKREWYFGEKIRGEIQSGFVIPANGRVIRGALSIAYQSGANIFDVNMDVVSIEVNGQEKPYQINTGAKKFTDPLQLSQGDVLSFKSIADIRRASSATVVVLIELDL